MHATGTCAYARGERLQEVAEAVREKIENTPINFRRKKINFTVSIGLAIFPVHGEEVLDLVDKADHNLYRAKADGKNRVII